MSMYKEHLERILVFINKYQQLINCHLVDFLTENLWKTCLPELLRRQLEEIEANGIDIDLNKMNLSKNDMDNELYNFINEIQSLKLESSPIGIAAKDFFRPHTEFEKNVHQEETCTKLQPEFMKTKKWYEVDIFTRAVVQLIEDSSSILVIDAGAGKGYSSLYLSEHYHVPVLAIESSQTNHNGALLRQDLLKKRKGQCSSLVGFITFLNIY